MDQATVDIAEILESDKLDIGEFERLRKAAHASEESWQELRKAISAPAPKGASAAKRVKRAAALLEIGRPRDAVKEIEDAKAGGEPAGALVLGRALLAAGEPKKALDAFEAGLKKAKGDFDLTAGAIEAQRESGDAAGALKDAEALLRKAGDRAEAHFQVGRALEALGQYDEAMDRYEEALERDAAHAKTLFRLAYNHELRGSQALALEYYKRCIDGTPTYASALVNYGLLLEDTGKYEEAIDVYHRILAIRPTHSRARLFLKDAESSLDMFYDEDQEKKSDRRNAILRIPVTDFELSVRARNCLNKMNIRNLGDLVTKTEEELLAYKNFGETSLQEIKQMLAQKGLRLGMFREGTAGAAPAPAEEQKSAGDEEMMMKKPISELELSVRSRNCMERLNVRTIGDLMQKSEAELLAVKNFGQTSLNEIKSRLSELGLALAADAPGVGGEAAGARGLVPPRREGEEPGMSASFVTEKDVAEEDEGDEEAIDLDDEGDDAEDE
jgi:DNA-directed RNA polymerase subunit alpha